MNGRALLERVAEHLRRQTLPQPVEGRVVPIAWAARAAEAIERYLAGETKSLDAAFGLTPRRGAPRTRQATQEDIARKVFDLRYTGRSWKQVADKASEDEWSVTDQRSLRRIWDDFAALVLSDEITLEDILPGPGS